MIYFTFFVLLPKEITYHIEEEGKPKDEEQEKTQVTPDKGLEDIDIE